jgi:hypothetical protein
LRTCRGVSRRVPGRVVSVLAFAAWSRHQR